MYGGTKKMRTCFRRFLTLFVFTVFIVQLFEPFFSFLTPEIAEAAQATLDADVSIKIPV